MSLTYQYRLSVPYQTMRIVDNEFNRNMCLSLCVSVVATPSPGYLYPGPVLSFDKSFKK